MFNNGLKKNRTYIYAVNITCRKSVVTEEYLSNEEYYNRKQLQDTL